KYIVAKGAYGDYVASYALYTAETGLAFYVSDGVTYAQSPDPGPGIWDGAWHHVVGTYDGASVRLYVDGAEVGNGPPSNLRINYALPTSADVLVGNGGNVLDGGGGRNLLIAGGSASTLIGGADEDILIAGTTNYDANLTALTDILALWSGGGSYADRVSRLVDDPGYAFSLN